MTPVLEGLERAEALLSEEGWIQGSMRTEEGYCLVGAILASFQETPYLEQDAEDLLIEAIRLNEIQRHYPRNGLTRWNDQLHLFGKRRVLRKIRKAQRLAKERGL